MTQPIAAWYPDPHDPTQIRWWDGTVWTEHVDQHPELVTVAAAPVAERQWEPTQKEWSNPVWPGGASPDRQLVPALAATPVAAMPAAPTQTLPPPPPPPPPPPSAPAPPPPYQPFPSPLPAGEPTKRISIQLRFGGILFAVAFVVGILFMTGIVNNLTGQFKDSTESSSTTDIRVYNGPGYHYEVPANWQKRLIDGAKHTDAVFSGPRGVGAYVHRGSDPVSLDLSDPAVVAALGTLLQKELAATYPNTQVVSNRPTKLDGASAIRTELSTPPSAGRSGIQIVVTTAIHNHRSYQLILLNGSAGDPAIDNEVKLVGASFRFD